MAKNKKTRADFRKNRNVRVRKTNLTRDFDSEKFEEDSTVRSERISGKGELTRRRTIMTSQTDESEDSGDHLAVDETQCRRGRVLSVHGLHSRVQDEEGKIYGCITRRILKTLSTDQRHVVAAGDRVWFRANDDTEQEGCIERVEPRYGVISRAVRGRQHILVTNVDQLVIVASAAEPRIKPNLIDRMLVASEKGRVRPIVCINKIDLVSPAELEPLIGVYGQMGYDSMLVSAQTGFGIDSLRKLLRNRETVVAGQSGVGKSSLLNAADPALALRVQTVSRENEKGRHTTTASNLIPLTGGGYVVDTPGIRQFQLWDVIPEELGGFFRDLRPYVNYCQFPDCTHTHEENCAVKNAVADGQLDERRYESYLKLREGEFE